MITLYQSSSCTITNYLCTCTDCTLSKPEYQDKFSFCFIRKGNFLFKVFRNDLDSHTGKMLLIKPGFEYRVAHLHTVPDECTIFSLSDKYYEYVNEVYSLNLNGFLKNQNLQAALINTNAELDYLHFCIFDSLKRNSFDRIQIESLLSQFIELAFNSDFNTVEFQKRLNNQSRSNLSKIERAKEHIQNCYSNNLTLEQIARECAMSTFHFTRIFKNITGVSPYQYLLSLRLTHAQRLLTHTSLPIAEVSEMSGFNNPAHFSFSFSEKIGLSPTSYRVGNHV